MNVKRDALHPPALRLEAVAAGDDPGPIAEHLRTCETCGAHVAWLKSEAEAFRARIDPIAFADAVRRRGAKTGGRRGAKVVWIAGPSIAAAAALALWIRHPPAVETIAPPAASSAPEADVARFKGGLAVAAIRERSGRQERLTGPFEVEPLDRIRIEIAADHEQRVTAGLLSEDGTWTLLQSPVALGVGTHYSDLGARFDDSPTDALLIVGSPDDVERARRTRRFEGVLAWRIKRASPR